MKTTQFLLAALLLSTGIIFAQNEKKPMTVRIKKVEKINGVEKVTDTTYTTTDYNSVMMISKPGETEFEKISQNVISITMNAGEAGSMETITIHHPGEEANKNLDSEMQWITSDIGMDFSESDKVTKGEKNEQRIVIQRETDEELNGTEKASPKKIQKVIIIRKIHVTEPTREELKSIGQHNSVQSEKIGLKELEFAPNPSNGITGLTLVMATKGPTDLTIYNINGQLIYREDLGDFTGRYSKELDLSGSPKGIYFLKVTQNNESITKKLILE